MSNGEFVSRVKLVDDFGNEVGVTLPVCSKCVNYNPGVFKGFCKDCVGGDGVIRHNYFKPRKEEE